MKQFIQTVKKRNPDTRGFFLQTNFIFLVIALIGYMTAGGQITTNTKKIDSITNKRLPVPDSVVEEKLVELALKGPVYEEAKHLNKINVYQLQGAKNSWLNLLTLSANYNDQTFAKTTASTGYVYPKFFFGLNIPLGTLISKTPVKAAKEQVEISKERQEELSRSIRADVLSKYKQYKAYGELIANKRLVVDDYQAAFMEAKKKFSNADITIEVHNTASKNYNDELAQLINLQLQQDLVKLEIEKIIGTKLENVLYTN